MRELGEIRDRITFAEDDPCPSNFISARLSVNYAENTLRIIMEQFKVDESRKENSKNE
jgi:hypothetical protein